MWERLPPDRQREAATLHLTERLERGRVLIDGSPASTVSLTLLDALPDESRHQFCAQLAELEVAAASDRRLMVGQELQLVSVSRRWL